MAYKRVTAGERTLIYEWKQGGFGIRETARLLARSASSISREIKRNTGFSNYRPKQAQAAATARALRPGPRRFTEGIRVEAVTRIQEGWTPDMICSRARLEGRLEEIQPAPRYDSQARLRNYSCGVSAGRAHQWPRQCVYQSRLPSSVPAADRKARVAARVDYQGNWRT